MAGARPNTSAVSTVTPARNSTTRASIATVSRRGRYAGLSATRALVPHIASSRPADAPMPASSTILREELGDHAAPRRRPARCAPRFRCCRSEVRASSMWATLAQAISSTNPTAPRQHQQRRLDLADHILLQRRDHDPAVGAGVLPLQARRDCRDFGARLRQRDARFQPREDAQAVAAAVVDAVAKRIGRPQLRMSGPERRELELRAASRLPPCRPRHSSVIGLPSTWRSPLKRRCHSRWLRMTSCSEPSWSSPGRNRRPSRGWMPSMGSRSGSPASPVRCSGGRCR